MTPIRRPRFLLEGHGNQLLWLLVVGLVVALVKPWGFVETTAPAPSGALVATPSPSPSPTPTPGPADLTSRIYDPLIFGDHELQPAWGLWPAGYLASFGFAMRAEPPSLPSDSPATSGPRPDRAPVWPVAIDIPTGNHLLLIGVNTPDGYSVDRINLVRLRADGSGANVVVLHPPSPWPSHFTVIGIDGGNGNGRPKFWAPGLYRLDLTINPGPIERSIEVRVEGPALDGTPSSSGPPGGQLHP